MVERPWCLYKLALVVPDDLISRREGNWTADVQRQNLILDVPIPRSTAESHLQNPTECPHSPRWVKERIPAEVPPDLLDIVLLRLELLPQTRRVDVPVALVPPPVHYLGYRRVVVGALERRYVGASLRRLGPRGRRRERVVAAVVGTVALRL